MPGWFAKNALTFSVIACLMGASSLMAAQPRDAEQIGPPARSQLVQPRASTHSERFELVVLKGEEQLLLFLDDFASNTPIAGATLAVEVDGNLGTLTEIAPGLYAAPWKAPRDQEEFEVEVTVASSVGDEQLHTQLRVPAALSTPQRNLALGSLTPNLDLLVPLLAFLAGAACALLALRRRDVASTSKPNEDATSHEAPLTALAAPSGVRTQGTH